MRARDSRRTAQTLFAFSPYKGLRIGEAKHVTWADADFTRHQLHVRGDPQTATKNGETRYVPMNREWIHSIDAGDAIRRLEGGSNPLRPESWGQLHALWRFVQGEVKYDWNNEKRRALMIVPVTGERKLFAANSVIRLSTRREAITEADWKFITDHALAVDRRGSGSSSASAHYLQSTCRAGRRNLKKRARN